MKQSFSIRTANINDPLDQNLFFVSIDNNATPSSVTPFILEKLGIPLSYLPKKADLTKGHHVLKIDKDKSIVFVVTFSDKPTRENLHFNFEQALVSYSEMINGKSVWIPLMGTHQDKLKPTDSLDIILSVFDQLIGGMFIPSKITISLPNALDQRIESEIDSKINTWQSNIDFTENIKTSNALPNESSKLDETVVLKHALSTEQDDQILREKGYSNQGIIGYIYSKKGKSTKELRQVYLTNVKDYFYYIDRSIETFSKSQSSEEKILGYLALSSERDDLAFFRYFNKERFDHFYCVLPNKKLLSDFNYEEETEKGFFGTFLLPQPSEDCLPLFIYSTNPDLFLFTTPNINEDYSKEDIFDESSSLGKPSIINEQEITDRINENLNLDKKFWWLNTKIYFWQQNDPKGNSDYYVEHFDIRQDPFEFKIEKGDLVIASNPKTKEITGIFEYSDQDPDGKFRRYKGLYAFKRKTSYNDLLYLLHFGAFLEEFTIGSLHELMKSYFIDIINSTELEIDDDIVLVQNNAQRTKIDNDGALAPKDLLGFENDIRAFSITLAQKRLVPPVAVVLFGNWGTGKSFFMHHLEKNIDHLSKYQGFAEELPTQEQLKRQTTKPFCEGVVQIKFNAWSYLDTNLWASLIANIFEKLDEYISGKSVKEEEKQKAQQIIADKLDIVAHEKENLKLEIKELSDEKDKIEEELAEMESNKETIYNSVIEKSIDDLKKEARKKTEDIENTIKNQLDEYGISRQRLEELSPSVLLDELTSWITFVRNLGKFNNTQLGIALLIIAFLIYYAIDPGNYLTSIKESVNSNIVYFFTIVGPIFIKVYKSYSKFKKLLNPVIEYKNKFNESFEKVKLDYDKSLINLNSQLTANTSDIINKKEQLHEVEKQIEKYNYALKHSVTKRAFFDFIKRKATDESYESHLGLISIIRKDFEKLSSLFEEVNIPDDIAPEEQEELEKRKKENEDFRELFSKPLDRIILYIDDLDRCDDDKVLEVLEAVHLLMAFPLFIVVVGVDKRCVSNALRYRNILKYTNLANATPKELKDEYEIKVIQPEEYLEKIFQIPFHLKTAEPESIKSLIGNLLKNEIEIAEEEPKEQDSSTLSFQTTTPVKKSKIVKPPSKLNKPKPVYVAPEDLLITPTELDYLKEMSIIVGDTPRTIKRFINIYRIIRAHEQLNYRKKEKDIDFLIIMFVLGMGIGDYRKESSSLFSNCLNDGVSNLADILVSEPETEKIKSLLESNDTLKQLLSISVSQVNNYIHFVNRFSFN